MSGPIPSVDLVDQYAQPRLGTPSRWDEMVDPASGVRDAWRDIGSVLRLLGPGGLAERRRTVASLLAQDGVTYRPHGASQEQPWALDPVPMLLDDQDWSRLEPALVQRTELLDAILTDIYGPRRLIADRLLPAEIIFGHAGFIRAVDQIRLPGLRQLFLSSTDLVRGPDGQWVVLSDRTQAPSGTGYAMANRRVVSRALPGLYRDSQIQRIGPFFQAMRGALQALAPNGSEVPRIVLLTSGISSETAFDQAYLSSLLGFPLVEGADLVARDGQVWQRSIGREEPVDVILRRVDSWFCDPLELRPDSQLGVPGLIEASRLGNVSIANGLGAGVLENPALFPFLPQLTEVLLGQQQMLPSVETWWCGDDLSRRHVIANIASLVIKPVSRQVMQTSKFGWELTIQQRDDLARQIEADPSAWVGQQAVQASTAPGAGPTGLEARPVSLRSFAVAEAGTYRVLPGGLSRVAPLSAAVVITTPDGALAKDVWVLSTSGAAAPHADSTDLVRGRVVSAVSPRVAESLFWLGRYAERAEDVSRLVAITDNRLHDQHPGGDPAMPGCVDVLVQAAFDITSLPAPAAGSDPRSQLRRIIGAIDQPGTMAHDVRRVRELADASRDQLSTDTWAVLGNTDQVLARYGGDITAMMSSLRSSLMAFAGLAAESMVRDSGWHFMDAGRRLERALQIARLLRSCLVIPTSHAVDALVEESTLVAAESIITHRRRYPARAGIDTMLDLLLFDRDNPRSVAFQLDRLAGDLRRISVSSAGEDELEGRTRRISAMLASVDVATLEVINASGHRADLDQLLTDVVDQLHTLSVDIERAHFAHLGSFRQLGSMSPLYTLESA